MYVHIYVCGLRRTYRARHEHVPALCRWHGAVQMWSVVAVVGPVSRRGTIGAERRVAARWRDPVGHLLVADTGGGLRGVACYGAASVAPGAHGSRRGGSESAGAAHVPGTLRVVHFNAHLEQLLADLKKKIRVSLYIYI